MGRQSLRFAMFGCGFWAHYQLSGWQEVEGVECVAVCDPTRGKAEAMAAKFEVPTAYSDADQLLASVQVEFIDVVTDVHSHEALVRKAAEKGLPVICQKPLAPSLEASQRCVAVCRDAGAPLFVHENWRWQRPLREVKSVLDSGRIGTPFRARLDMISGFEVFENQPFLKELDRFILTDLGTHVLDVARFYFGEAEELYCQTHQIHQDIQGEDVATVMMRMNRGRTTVTCNLAYAGNPLEREAFPQTLLFIEGDRGSIELDVNYWLRVTTTEGTLSRRVPPPMFDWVNPDYAVVQSSIVDCHRDLARAIADPRHPAETTGEDNLKTLELVYASYESDEQRRVIQFA